ncbi:hypothetical protein Peur_034404 [Populus x canadensis]
MLLEEQTMAEVKIPSAAAGCESAMAAGAEDYAAVEAGDGCVLRGCWTVGGESGGAGEKPKRKKERTRLWFSCCSGDRGKMCFGFENGDGKGSVLLKVDGRERV